MLDRRDITRLYDRHAEPMLGFFARRRRWALPAGGLAAAAAAAAVAITLTSGADAGRIGPAPADAAEALHRVAVVAARAVAPVPRDDQYYYVRTRATWMSMFAGEDPRHEHAVTLVAHEREIWLSVARPGRLVDRVVGTRPLTPADATREQGPAAPGIELVGEVEDRAGRTGTAVAFTEAGVRELIFDPETAELLAERQVLVDPATAEIDAPAGTVIGDTAYLERAVTDALTTG